MRCQTARPHPGPLPKGEGDVPILGRLPIRAFVPHSWTAPSESTKIGLEKQALQNDISLILCNNSTQNAIIKLRKCRFGRHSNRMKPDLMSLRAVFAKQSKRSSSPDCFVASAAMAGTRCQCNDSLSKRSKKESPICVYSTKSKKKSSPKNARF